MGFRNDTYATVWEVDVKSDTFTTGRISISHKNKNTGEYETDFSSYVCFVGSATSKKAGSLAPKSRIKLKSVDVTNKFNKDTRENFYSFKIYDFEVVDNNGSAPTTVRDAASELEFSVESNEEDGGNNQLPF